MARIQINLELDSNQDAELLSKLTLALSGRTQSEKHQQLDETGKKDFMLMKDATIESRTAFLPENAETKKSEPENFRDVSDYSEEELKAIPNDELKFIATNLGIDWASAEGKNTNAKLAKLILKHYDYGKPAESEDIKEDNSDEEAYEANRSASGENTKEDSKKATSNDVTIDELKVELGAKVEANRDAIVEKLNELGATKLTNLDESHYSEFMDFLKAL